MDLIDAIKNRRTANSGFADKEVSEEHIELLIRMASHSPSHFNSQPWRFIIIDDKEIIKKIAVTAGDAMTELMDDGRFWKQYRKYFRFSEEEMEMTKDGIHIDHLQIGRAHV